ncbi:MAG: hypothetical protein AAF700_05920 [Pseudomonadota bacterium]
MTQSSFTFTLSEDLDTVQTVTEEHFGGIYTGYRNFRRFEDADTEIGLTTIRWPGGAAAENASWFGLEFENLVDPNRNKEGVREMAARAIEDGLPLNIILPTNEYAGDAARFKTDLRALLERMNDGTLGPMPAEITFEIGNEYYATSNFKNDAGAYGEIVSAAAQVFAEFKAETPDGLSGIEINLAAQIGKEADENDAILDALTSDDLAQIDTLIFHRFAWGIEDARAREDRVEDNLEAWVTAGLDANYETYMSGWNVASWTRNEALAKYEDEMLDVYGETINRSLIDLDARNHVGFETFWQTGNVTSQHGVVTATKWGLVNRDYGLAQASAMIEIFTKGLELGVDSAAIYGVDTPYAAHLSWGGEVFVGGAMMSMLSESLVGTWVIETDAANQRDGEMNLHAFEDEDRVVLYLSADAFDDGVTSLEAQLDLSGLGYAFNDLSARSLTSELDANWMQTYGITDLAGVDESPESALYETGVISEAFVAFEHDVISFEFTQSYEVIEVILTKTDETLVLGTENADALRGGEQDDVIDGYAGDDILDGGEGGADILTGGEGHDSFVFTKDGVADIVTDFAAGEDILDLRAITADVDFLKMAIGDDATIRVGSKGSDAWIHGVITFEQVGEDVMIRMLSRDGARGQDKLEDIAILTGQTLDQLSLADMLV